MKVLDLECAQHHVFEGWFGSDDEFQSQLARGLIECPMCGDSTILKRLSAPRLNLGASRESSREVAEAPKSSTAVVPSGAGNAAATVGPSAVALQQAWMQAVRHVMANTEDVGNRFAEEARRIHYGEVEDRNIRGKASPKETEALIEEGIAVMPLAIPDALKEPLQ
jgi:hypothetical protein